MEFIEYYRIIRRRIWIAVGMAALTAAVVVAARLMPEEVVYPAAGRVLVYEIAKREVQVAGNELQIGPHGDEGRFWNSLGQFVRSTRLLEAAAADIGIVGGEVERRLEHASARRIGDSNALQVTAGADNKDVAVELCNAVMARLGETWQARQVDWVGLARDTLTERLPPLREEISRLESEADKLTVPHQGSKPPDVLASLEAELATIQTQLSTTVLSMGTAQARADALEGATERGPARLARERVPRAPSPRVTTLQEAILQKQIQLDEARSRRTSEHQDVRAIEAQIKAFQERLKQVEEAGEEEVNPEVSLLLQGITVEAEVEAVALGRQLELLRGQAAEIRGRLPTVRVDARAFEQIDGQLTGAQQTYAAVQDYIDRLEVEAEQLNSAPLMEVLEAAVAQPVPRGLARFAMRLGVAIFAGGGLGIVIIFVLHYVDFSFQDEEEAERMLGVRVLAGIPRSDIVPYSAAPEASSEGESPVERRQE